VTLRRVKDILWVLVLFGLVAAILRMTMGLGATTDLSDQVPWGLWKVLNMIAGVALATGGFVLAFAVHVLRVKVLSPLLRPALLVAFLGYAASCMALMMDIGLPHRFWHPIFFWNIHSFLFEVFWCVLLYFSITVLEVSPIALENTPFAGLKRLLKRSSTPVVVLGITFSTMHHTTLGSLFLVSPDRIHELWYSSLLPFFFILSAIGAGIFCVVVVTLVMMRLYRREPPMAALKVASVIAVVVLSIYFVLRIGDLASRGSLAAAFSGLWEGNLFITEMLLSVIIPVGMVLVPRIRRSPGGLMAAGLFAVAGLAFNRVDVGIFAYFRSSGASYYPPLSELFLTLAIPAAAGLFFFMFVERFHVFTLDGSVSDPATPGTVTEFDEQTSVWRGAFLSNLERISLMFVIVVPLALAFFLPRATAETEEPSPVHSAMGADAARKVLKIDGNRDGEFVLFPHDAHKDRMGGEESCATCHHMDRPGDQFAACRTCHSDMHNTTSIFNHDDHVKQVAAAAGHTGRLAGNYSCRECHTQGEPKYRENAKACHECHGDDMRMAKPKAGARSDLAVGHTRALHGSCVKCHKAKAEEVDRPILGECRTCHDVNCSRDEDSSSQVKNCTTCHG